jgi:hypothetical protein
MYAEIATLRLFLYIFKILCIKTGTGVSAVGVGSSHGYAGQIIYSNFSIDPYLENVTVLAYKRENIPMNLK